MLCHMGHMQTLPQHLLLGTSGPAMVVSDSLWKHTCEDCAVLPLVTQQPVSDRDPWRAHSWPSNRLVGDAVFPPVLNRQRLCLWLVQWSAPPQAYCAEVPLKSSCNSGSLYILCHWRARLPAAPSYRQLSHYCTRQVVCNEVPLNIEWSDHQTLATVASGVLCIGYHWHVRG